MKRNEATLVVAMLLFPACRNLGRAQTLPPAILEVDVENYVQYSEDTSDLSKFAADPNLTAAVPPRNFNFFLQIADIVAVNGQPAKGTLTRNSRAFALTTAADPGQAIADTVRGAVSADTFEFVNSDGTPIGTIVSYGLGAGTRTPGAPLSITRGNFAITGGTGAFLGARGQLGNTAGPPRNASVTEDPANRRRNGGTRTRYVLEVIPAFQPQIAMTPGGPAVFHADFSPVTAAKPAKAGEILIVQAMGLGPTIPGVNPGQPFPTDSQQQVNSPVAVTINGQTAEVINSIGWPGLVDTYRVDFLATDGNKAGTAAIQLAAAWIAGPAVTIAIQ